MSLKIATTLYIILNSLNWMDIFFKKLIFFDAMVLKRGTWLNLRLHFATF